MNIEKPGSGNKKEKFDIPSDKVLAGAVENPDGTWDTSKAVLMDKISPNTKLRYEGQEWQKRMEIPESVKPGNADMVFYRLRNAMLVNQKTMDTEPNNQAAQVAAKRYADLRLQLDKLQTLTFMRHLSAREAVDTLHADIEDAEANLDHFTTEDARSEREAHVKLMKDLEQKLNQESLANPE